MSNSIRSSPGAGIARWPSTHALTEKTRVEDKPLKFDAQASGFEANTPPQRGPPAFLSAAAESLGLTPEALGERLRAGESLEDIAASQGVSKEAVLEDIAADFQAKHPEASDDEADAVAARALEGPPKPRAPPGLEGVAQALGLSTDELQAQLTSGATVAEVAESQGLSADELLTALAADVQSKHPELDAEQAQDIARRLLESRPPPFRVGEYLQRQIEP